MPYLKICPHQYRTSLLILIHVNPLSMTSYANRVFCQLSLGELPPHVTKVPARISCANTRKLEYLPYPLIYPPHSGEEDLEKNALDSQLVRLRHFFPRLVVWRFLTHMTVSPSGTLSSPPVTGY